MHRSDVRGAVLRIALLGTALLFAAFAAGAHAQTDSPEEKPTVKVGGTIFADYTYTIDPTKIVEGEEIHPNSFNVARAYINVTGKAHRLVGFRITPDIVNPSASDSSSLVGNQVFRLKYAYLQFELEDWVTEGSWARFGVQQTPYIDYTDGIYRYRFQGPIFPDREGKLTSADRGVSARVSFPGDRGDLHAGVYNGDGYSKSEANDRKAFQGRISFRPAPGEGVLNGLRLALFFDGDQYAAGNPRVRWLGNSTFEHEHVNAGIEYLFARDQIAAGEPEIDSEGFSVWATPKVGNGWEALLRYDELKPDKDEDAKKKTAIGGIAYWFPVAKGASGALLLDYQKVELDGSSDQEQVALHGLLNF